jgi:hypothetical protein
VQSGASTLDACSEEWDSIDLGNWAPPPPSASQLSEDDALQIARSLDDYQHVTVSDHGGSNETGYWISVHDELAGLEHVINTWPGYWDFLVTFLSGKQRIYFSSGVALDGEGSAAHSQQAAPGEQHSAGIPPAAAAG